MGRAKKYRIKLTEETQEDLKMLVSRGEASSRVIRRAYVLLLANDAKGDEAIAEALRIARSTVHNIRKRFVNKGLEAALYDKPRPGAQRKLDSRAEARLIALACSDAPEGREHWTMQLLADKLVELKLVGEISDETVRRRLKKTDLSLGKRNSGALVS